MCFKLQTALEMLPSVKDLLQTLTRVIFLGFVVPVSSNSCFAYVLGEFNQPALYCCFCLSRAAFRGDLYQTKNTDERICYREKTKHTCAKRRDPYPILSDFMEQKALRLFIYILIETVSFPFQLTYLYLEDS